MTSTLHQHTSSGQLYKLHQLQWISFPIRVYKISRLCVWVLMTMLARVMFLQTESSLQEDWVVLHRVVVYVTGRIHRAFECVTGRIHRAFEYVIGRIHRAFGNGASSIPCKSSHTCSCLGLIQISAVFCRHYPVNPAQAMKTMKSKLCAPHRHKQNTCQLVYRGMISEVPLWCTHNGSNGLSCCISELGIQCAYVLIWPDVKMCTGQLATGK